MNNTELDKWSEETDKEKKRIASRIKSELAGSLSADDEDNRMIRIY